MASIERIMNPRRISLHVLWSVTLLCALSLILIPGLPGCQRNGAGNSEENAESGDATPKREDFIAVEIDGKTFDLEPAVTEDARIRGLGGRTELAADEGMLFVFPDLAVRNFVMRDCYMSIDIIFLDASGRITAMHHMPMEEPRGADESEFDYETRLNRYSSRFRAQYAIELQGGMLEQLNLRVQQKIPLDLERLKELAR